MTIEGAGKPRILPLEGARFMIALTVAVGHWLPAYMRFTPWGNEVRQTVLEAMMSGFFVLSGLVIHYAYHGLKCEDVGRFALARFARLYPLYLLLVIVPIYIWGVVYFPQSRELSWAYLSFITMTQTWFPTLIDGKLISNYFPILSTLVAWSISTEVFFYLVYAVIAPRWPWMFSRGFAAALYVATVSYCYAADTPGRLDGAWLFYVSPYLHVAEFILGAAAAQYFLRHGVAVEGAWRMLPVAALYLGGYGVLLWENQQPIWHMQLFAPCLAFLLYGLARWRSPAAALLGGGAMVALSNLTYGIYLIHGWWIMAILGADLPNVLTKNLVTLAGLFLISGLLYWFYEKPARKWLRQWR